jgi:hypothetical protein
LQINNEDAEAGVGYIQVAYYAIIRRPHTIDFEAVFGDRYVPLHRADNPQHRTNQFNYLQIAKITGCWRASDVTGLLALFDPERGDSVLFIEEKEAKVVKAEIPHL